MKARSRARLVTGLFFILSSVASAAPIPAGLAAAVRQVANFTPFEIEAGFYVPSGITKSINVVKNAVTGRGYAGPVIFGSAFIAGALTAFYNEVSNEANGTGTALGNCVRGAGRNGTLSAGMDMVCSSASSTQYAGEADYPQVPGATAYWYGSAATPDNNIAVSHLVWNSWNSATNRYDRVESQGVWEIAVNCGGYTSLQQVSRAMIAEGIGSRFVAAAGARCPPKTNVQTVTLQDMIRGKPEMGLSPDASIIPEINDKIQRYLIANSNSPWPYLDAAGMPVDDRSVTSLPGISGITFPYPGVSAADAGLTGLPAGTTTGTGGGTTTGTGGGTTTGTGGGTTTGTGGGTTTGTGGGTTTGTGGGTTTGTGGGTTTGTGGGTGASDAARDSTLQRLEAQLQQAITLNQEMRDDLRSANALIDQLLLRWDAASQRLEQATKDGAQETTLQALRTDVTQLNDIMQLARAQSDHIGGLLIDANAQRSALQQQVQTLNDAATITNSSLQTANDQRTDTNTKLQTANDQRVETNSKLQTGNDQRVETNTKLQTANDQRVETNSKLQTGNDQRVETNTKLQTANDQRVETNTKLDTVKDKLQTANDQQTATNDKLDSLKEKADQQKSVLEQIASFFSDFWDRLTNLISNTLTSFFERLSEWTRTMATELFVPKSGVKPRWDTISASYGHKFPLGFQAWIPKPESVSGAFDCKLVDVDLTSSFGLKAQARLTVNPCSGPIGDFAHNTMRPIWTVLVLVGLAWAMVHRVADSEASE